MKKNSNNLTKAVILLLIITMLALIATAGTYAKYTTSVTGTGTAIVGEWDIDISDGTNNITEATFEIDLADTLTSNDTGNKFIQPGSTGEFTITVTNSGDVPATITAAVTDSSSTLFTQGQFSLQTEGTTNGVKVEPNSKQDVKITWAWTYDLNLAGAADTEDTTIGTSTNAQSDISETICEITLTATQVDPNAGA